MTSQPTNAQGDPFREGPAGREVESVAQSTGLPNTQDVEITWPSDEIYELVDRILECKQLGPNVGDGPRIDHIDCDTAARLIAAHDHKIVEEATRETVDFLNLNFKRLPTHSLLEMVKEVTFRIVMVETARDGMRDKDIPDLRTQLTASREECARLRQRILEWKLALPWDYHWDWLRSGMQAEIVTPPPSAAPLHASDCAVYNMPAYPNGPCDCGATPAGSAEKGPL